MMDNEPELTERRADAAEMAEMLGVTEADVRRWAADGSMPAERGADGDPWFRVRERIDEASGFSSSIRLYDGPADRARVDRARRARRAREIAASDHGGVDLDRLLAQLAERLGRVIPDAMAVTSDLGYVTVHDAGGATVAAADVAFSLGFVDDGPRSAPERVRDVAEAVLDRLQEELAEETSDPWPGRGRGVLPMPHAELSEDGALVRWWYGPANAPVLELEPLVIGELLRRR